jgi:aldehyde:ferredoxin oxidoreductase
MYGYAGSILECDLSRQNTFYMSTDEYALKYIGGRGLASRLYWERANAKASALEPTNPLIISNGPLAGYSGVSGSRWQICAKSPAITPESFNYANLGGSWGSYLKFAGFDSLIINGASIKPVYLFIHDKLCEFRDASHLWGKGAAQVRDILKSEWGDEIKVLSIGPAGENLVSFATILAENDACGAAGLGAVMGSKKLKAIAVVGHSQPAPADPVLLKQLTSIIHNLDKVGKEQAIVPLIKGMKIKKQACFGCIAGCRRSLIQTDIGSQGKYLCGSGMFYQKLAFDHYHETNEVPFLATRLCDDFGLDTHSISSIIKWLAKCSQNGIISEKYSGLPLSKIGSLEFIKELVKIITYRDNFGDILAQGPLKAARKLSPLSEKMLNDHTCKDGSYAAYCARVYITTALIHAMEPRQSNPQLTEIGSTVWRWVNWVSGSNNPEVTGDDLTFIANYFWGSKEAADLSSYKGKSLAAKMIQDRHYVKESAILCTFPWHIAFIERNRPQIIAELLNAVTGNNYSEEGLLKMGECFFNLQRAILIRERGYGREGDTIPEAWYSIPVSEAFYMNPKMMVPGPDGQPITRKGATINKEEFEAMKNEFYRLRGWDIETGLQKETKLKELGLADIASKLKNVKLVR